MSKGYNMAGWRVGFCAGNAEMIRGLATIKGYYDYGMFQAIQIAAIVALRDTEAAVEATIGNLPNAAAMPCRWLAAHRLGIDPPKAGMFVWAKVPERWQQRMNTMDFAMMLAREWRRGGQPGSGFGPAAKAILRMALVENENRLRQAVRQIARCLERQSQNFATSSGVEPSSI